MGSFKKALFFLLAIPAASVPAKTCAVCKPPVAASLLQITRRDRDWTAGLVAAKGADAVEVAIQIQTSDIDFAGTETGANISFKIGGQWNAPMEFVKMVPIRGLANLSLRLSDWPSAIRMTALGDDAWSIESILMSTSGHDIVVLNKTEGDYERRMGSIHWIDQDDSPREYKVPQYKLARSAPLGMSNLSNGTGNTNLTNLTNMTHFTNSSDVANLTISTNTTDLMNSTGSATETPGSANCTTRFDERVHSMIYATSPPGTPCVFGVDPRDEGAHCIFDDGKYGSLGWCYTDGNKQSWGACGEACPLYGQELIVGRKIERLLKEVREQGKAIRNMLSRPAPTNATARMTLFSVPKRSLGTLSSSPNMTLEPKTPPRGNWSGNGTGATRSKSTTSPPLSTTNQSNTTDQTNLSSSRNMTHLMGNADVANLTISTNTTDLTSSAGGTLETPRNTNCTTRFDKRVHSMILMTSPPGTPCVFGLDPRDEGAHCIFDDGQYGSLGWCYTGANKDAWGACGETCPLYGQAKILDRKIDQVLKELEAESDVLKMVFPLSPPTDLTANTTRVVNSTIEATLPPPNVSQPMMPPSGDQGDNATALTNATVKTTLTKNTSPTR